jgi:hypothetical protein
MNSWPFHELKRQVEYKAAWEGVPVITLSDEGDERHHDGLLSMRGETPRTPVRDDRGALSPTVVQKVRRGGRTATWSRL